MIRDTDISRNGGSCGTDSHGTTRVDLLRTLLTSILVQNVGIIVIDQNC